jgi:hypothetical protein
VIEFPKLLESARRILETCQRHGENFSDLTWIRLKRVWMRYQANERGNHEVGPQRRDVVERSENLDVFRQEADLFVCLPDGCGEERVIDLGFVSASWKRNLAAVMRQTVRALGEKHMNFVLLHEEGDENCGGQRRRGLEPLAWTGPQQAAESGGDVGAHR